MYWWLQVKWQKPAPSPWNSHKIVWEANQYIWFIYGPLKTLNNTRGKVSVSMNADPINMIHKSQKLTKKVLNKELEEYFRSNRSISWRKQVWTPNRYPRHNLPKLYMESNPCIFFNTAHIKFAITPEDEFQNQLMLIW